LQSNVIFITQDAGS